MLILVYYELSLCITKNESLYREKVAEALIVTHGALEHAAAELVVVDELGIHLQKVHLDECI